MTLKVEREIVGAGNAFSFMQSNDELGPDKPIGNFGIGDINDIIKCTIFGYAAEAQPYAARGINRIDTGFTNEEWTWFAHVDGHRSDLHHGRAMGAWLAENYNDEEHFTEARRYLEIFWQSVKRTRQEMLRDELNEYMPLCVLGGLAEDYKHGMEPFEAGIEMYEHWLGERGIGKTDISLKKSLKPYELGYAMCRHYLHGEFDRDDLLKAGERMLTANLTDKYDNGWLDGGQYLRAATWLMAVHWYPALHYGEELPAPVDVLLKAWDHLPGITRPF